MRNSLLQAFPTCWQDMMDVYQKLKNDRSGYMNLHLHPDSNNRKLVFSYLLTHEGERERLVCLMIDQNGILTITSINSAHLKHAVLGGASSTRETRPWGIVQQKFLTRGKNQWWQRWGRGAWRGDRRLTGKKMWIVTAPLRRGRRIRGRWKRFVASVTSKTRGRYQRTLHERSPAVSE